MASLATSCGCSSAGRARPRLWPGRGFETCHSLHFGCVLALRGRATWCWRCGMCVATDQAPCSETPRPTGRSRSGTAEVDLCRVRLDGRGHHPSASRLLRRARWGRGFKSRTRSQSTGTPWSSRFGVEIGRNDWAAPEPVTGCISVGFGSKPGRAAALRAAGCGFNPYHLQQCNIASLTQWPECRPV